MDAILISSASLIEISVNSGLIFIRNGRNLSYKTGTRFLSIVEDNSLKTFYNTVDLLSLSSRISLIKYYYFDFNDFQLPKTVWKNLSLNNMKFLVDNDCGRIFDETTIPEINSYVEFLSDSK